MNSCGHLIIEKTLSAGASKRARGWRRRAARLIAEVYDEQDARWRGIADAAHRVPANGAGG
jgi:hypothetical protein